MSVPGHTRRRAAPSGFVLSHRLERPRGCDACGAPVDFVFKPDVKNNPGDFCLIPACDVHCAQAAFNERWRRPREE